MRRTILLADDSPTIRRLVTQTFADANFKIVEVSNGDAAIKAVEEVRPNLVIADIYMPGKNGYEVCAYIRNHSALKATPVILLVGAFDAFDEETAKQAGATANITKPFEPRALIDLVKSVFQGAHEQQREPEPEAEPEPVAKPLRKLEPVHEQAREPEQPAHAASAPAKAVPTEEDLLGLEAIFKGEPAAPTVISDDDVDRIADRVIQKLSSQVIESIAWDVVPDIAEKIVREELKRIDES
jgi:DNA-binding response OmpR family regulator